MRVTGKFTDFYVDVTKNGVKIPQEKYLNNGAYPIIDQGRKQIAGKWNDQDGIFDDVPAIIFGDHTRVIKYVTEPFFIGADGVKILRPVNASDNPKYLFYALQAAQIPDLGYSRHFKAVKELNVRICPRVQQDEIVGVLEKIDAIIGLQTKNIEKLDQLVKSRFIEMFGDPMQNPMGWPQKLFLDMGYCKNGMNFHTGDNGIEIHCLGVGDFKNLSIIDGTDHLPMISLNEEPPEESMLQNGDIVFVRSNGNKALVGRCLVVYPHSTPTTYSGFCIRYRLTSDDVNTAYLLRVLKTDSMRKKMAGRGANIQNLNQQILATLNIPIPPLELQEQFAAFVAQTDKSKVEMQKSLEKLEVLKRALMQKYFG